MFQGSKVCLATLVLAIAVTTINGKNIKEEANNNIANFMMRNIGLSKSNPSRSVNCFDYYTPILTGIAAKYEEDYQKCVATALDGITAIDEATAPARQSIADSAESGCKLVSACSESTTSVTFLQCYASTGSTNSAIMYSVSANSSALLADVEQQIILIDTNKYKCGNESERASIESTAATYKELELCLSGKTPVPSTGSDTNRVAGEPVPETAEEPEQKPAEEPEQKPAEEPEQKPAGEPEKKPAENPAPKPEGESQSETEGEPKSEP